jgi:hypothetical protein
MQESIRTCATAVAKKGERVSNQALGLEFSDSNTLPVEPTWKKTRTE